MKRLLPVTTLLLLMSLSVTACADPMPVDVHQLGDRSICVRLSDDPGATNVTAVASSEGVIVIDTERAQAIALELKQTIGRELGRQDFRYVINTHADWDHSMGNQAFPEAQVVGHDRAVEEMLDFDSRRIEFATRLQEAWIDYLEEEYRTLDPDSEEARINRRRSFYSSLAVEELTDGYTVTPPSMTFNDALTLHLGDITVSMVYVGPAHTTSDILIRIDEEGVLVVGDLFSKESLPYIEAASDVPYFLQELDGLLDGSVEIRHVVGGHGGFMDAAELRLKRDYIRWVFEGVQAARAEGVSLEEATRRLALSEYPIDLSHLSHTWGDDADFHLLNIENVWNSLGG